MHKRSLVFLFLGLLVGGGLYAQPSIGPDVTVSDTGAIAFWGDVGGISAFSLQTTSCNVGNATAEWLDSDNTHPLIGQQMYRLMDGKMELIGISWLKHSFCAVNENSCGNCQNTPCDTLGIGCADTYGTGLNADQGNLGPRYDVNAATGQYQYPFPTQNVTGNPIFKRLQIESTDLDPALNPGAQYFGEVIYITTDEQAFGTQFNNLCYREAVVTGPAGTSGFEMAYTGPTVTEATAMDAWAAQDPDVVIVDVMIPNDGLLKVAYKVTDNGNGTWNYEYAVYNMNSHRSVRGFSAPVPSSVTTTNVDFHDVFYHSGEPFDGTDWGSAQSGNLLTWTTQTFAQNENANAIRWATSYNFRFDANSPPIAANAVIELFRPGTPTTVTVPVMGPESQVAVADFLASPVSGGSPLVVDFINQSAGNLTDYEWDFGDGNTSTEANPTHIYLNEGVYTVSLTASGPVGVDTIVRTDYIDVGAPVHTYTIEGSSAFAGSTLTLPIRGGTPAFLQAFSAAVNYPTDLLFGVSATLDGTDPEAIGAEFITFQVDEVAGTMTVEVIMDMIPLSGIVLPANLDQTFANLVFEVDGTFTDGETRLITFENGLGATPVNNVFIDTNGIEIPVATTGTEITFFNQASFLRGNCDGQGIINLVDALLVLNFLFVGVAPPPCQKACDFDDSGNLSILDGTGILFWLFSSGPAPAAPWPNVAPDPTPDSLPCF